MSLVVTRVHSLAEDPVRRAGILSLRSEKALGSETPADLPWLPAPTGQQTPCGPWAPLLRNTHRLPCNLDVKSQPTSIAWLLLHVEEEYLDEITLHHFFPDLPLPNIEDKL